MTIRSNCRDIHIDKASDENQVISYEDAADLVTARSLVKYSPEFEFAYELDPEGALGIMRPLADGTCEAIDVVDTQDELALGLEEAYEQDERLQELFPTLEDSRGRTGSRSPPRRSRPQCGVTCRCSTGCRWWRLMLAL